MRFFLQSCCDSGEGEGLHQQLVSRSRPASSLSKITYKTIDVKLQFISSHNLVHSLLYFVLQVATLNKVLNISSMTRYILGLYTNLEQVLTTLPLLLDSHMLYVFVVFRSRPFQCSWQEKMLLFDPKLDQVRPSGASYIRLLIQGK